MSTVDPTGPQDDYTTGPSMSSSATGGGTAVSAGPGRTTARRSALARPPSLRDARLALPVALLLLLVLSTSTVLAYRNGVRRLVAQRQEEAEMSEGEAAGERKCGERRTLQWHTHVSCGQRGPGTGPA